MNHTFGLFDPNTSYMISRSVPFSMTLNGPNPDIKVTPIIFDAEYVSTGTAVV